MKICFGDSESVDGVTVRPVALASFGFGTGDKGEGGGGSSAIPMGMYITEGGHTRFQPNTVALVVGAGIGTFLATKGLASLVRAFRGRP